MITNKGSSIITKYLLGQAPEYAAHLALGIGAAPLESNENDNSVPTKQNMDFEAFRVPVTSRGLVNDFVTIDLNSWSSNGEQVVIETSTFHGARVGEEVFINFAENEFSSREGSFLIVATTSSSITYEDSSSASASWETSGTDTATVSYNRERMIFKGQLPVDQYYKMTEISLYPASSNNLAQQYDSKLISGFLSTEGWNIVTNNTENVIASTSVSISKSDGDISETSFLIPGTSSSANVLFVNSDNEAFTFFNRKSRGEGARLYNSSLMIRGDVVSFENSELNISASTNYIYTSDVSLDLSKNSPNDYIKIAVCVVSSSYSDVEAPYETRIRLDFIDTATNGRAVSKEIISYQQIEGSRYYIISKQLKDFVVDENFSWARIGEIRVYPQTLDSFGNSTQDYVILDGIRLDNINTENPLYGMIAYSRLKNGYENGIPVEKIENSQGYIEYRIGINIV
jgi:hypothetical protein